MKRLSCLTIICTLFIALAPASRAQARGISGPMVVSDSWPQVTSIAAWANDVLRIEGKTNASERDQAVALYYWSRFLVMSPKAGTEPYEGPYNQESRLVTDIPKVMFVHGCGDCDYQARVLEAIWCLYRGDDYAARRTTLISDSHTMVELKWGNAWHAFDPLNGVFFLENDQPEANIISFAQEANAEQLIRDNEHFVNRARPFFERVRAWDQPGEWKMHLDIDGFYENYAAFQSAGSPSHSVYATHSLPSTYPMSDLNWHLARGTTVQRQWSTGDNFYRPQATSAQFGEQGRHYRQAVEWGPLVTHWNRDEDLYNFPKIEPYLTLTTADSDPSFINQRTLYLVGSGLMTYEPDLASDAYLDAVEDTHGLFRADAAPYLRPQTAKEPGSVIFKIQSPYIIADADLVADVELAAGDSARFLLSTDQGASWEEVASGSGSVNANLGKSRFHGIQQSVSGTYQYLVKFECTAAHDASNTGLGRLTIKTRIDGNINALPRIVDGTNTIRFKVQDESLVSAPIRLEYKWTAGDTERSHVHHLYPGDFSDNEASYQFDAQGLTRCTEYSFSYGVKDSGSSADDDPFTSGSQYATREKQLDTPSPGRHGCGCSAPGGSIALLLCPLVLGSLLTLQSAKRR